MALPAFYRLNGPVSGKFGKTALRLFSSKTDGVIQVQRAGGITKIIMNRPEKMNALSDEMYQKFTAAMKEASKDPNSKITVIAGNGPAFSAGTDLATFTKGDIAKHSDEVLIPFIESHIVHEKPLIGLVHGLAAGVMVTTLALYDVIFASDKAKFWTPFARLGLVAEGCSSITFPRLMGSLKAAEMLLFDKTLTAEEAMARNLVNEVIPHAKFADETQKRLDGYVKFHAEAMQESKRLLRLATKQELLDCNRREMQTIVRMRQSEATKKAVAEFTKKK